MTKIVRIWLYGSRPYIAVHYLVPVAFGVFLASKIFDKPINYFHGILIGLSIFFSFQTSIILNDLNDVKADKLAKRRTPLNSDDISIKQYTSLAVFFFVISIVLALIISYRVFLIVLLGNMLHFSYSSPPLRLKRYYPLSICLLAFGALLAAIAGYALYDQAKPFISFPLRTALFIMIPLFLAMNFRDLADYEGDRMTDARTLFTILGMEKGRIVNAILMLLSYLSVPVILQYPVLLTAALPLGLASMYFCFEKPFKERYIFYVYFAFILILMILFYLKPEIIIK